MDTRGQVELAHADSRWCLLPSEGPSLQRFRSQGKVGLLACRTSAWMGAEGETSDRPLLQVPCSESATQRRVGSLPGCFISRRAQT